MGRKAPFASQQQFHQWAKMQSKKERKFMLVYFVSNAKWTLLLFNKNVKLLLNPWGDQTYRWNFQSVSQSTESTEEWIAVVSLIWASQLFLSVLTDLPSGLRYDSSTKSLCCLRCRTKLSIKLQMKQHWQIHNKPSLHWMATLQRRERIAGAWSLQGLGITVEHFRFTMVSMQQISIASLWRFMKVMAAYQ